MTYTITIGKDTEKQGNAVMYTYDASATSGSRFAQLSNLTSSHSWLSDVGDRLYIGNASKFYGIRVKVSTAQVGGTIILKTSRAGIVMTESSMIAINDSTSNILVSPSYLVQTSNSETIKWNIQDDSTWVSGDNVLNVIPNTGDAKFWVCLEFSVAASTAPISTNVGIITENIYRHSRNNGIEEIWFYGPISPTQILTRGAGEIRASRSNYVSNMTLITGTSFSSIQFRSGSPASDRAEFIMDFPSNMDFSTGINMYAYFGNSLTVTNGNVTTTTLLLRDGKAINVVAETSTASGTFSTVVNAIKKVTLFNNVSIPRLGDKLFVVIRRTDSASNDLLLLYVESEIRVFKVC